MTFFADPSFFMLLALAVAGAAFLGLRERPIARYGMVASAAFLACLFCKDLPGLAVAALFVATATLSTRWVLASPRSNGRFAVAFALILVPLLSAKAGAVFDQNLLGFIGVSYITFKALQVLFEVRDGVIEELGLFDYLYFLLFFPVFTSGPIDRSRRFAEDARKIRSRDEYAGLLARGILLLLVGLVYTFVIAVWLHRFYAPTTWGTGPFLAELGVQVRTAYVYGLYLFFDFAGYSLMAMGASYFFASGRRATSARRSRPWISRLLEPVEHHAVVLAARLRVHAVLALGAEAPLVRQPAGRRMLGLRVRHGPYGRLAWPHGQLLAVRPVSRPAASRH